MEIDRTGPIRLAVTRLISNTINQVFRYGVPSSTQSIEPRLIKIDDGSKLYTTSRREPKLIKIDGRVHS